MGMTCCWHLLNWIKMDWVDFLHVMNIWIAYRYYGQKDVCIPILGAGLTRFDGGSGASIPQQELLDMIIWSYKLSSHKIKSPRKLRIICRRDEDFSLDKIDSQA